MTDLDLAGKVRALPVLRKPAAYATANGDYIAELVDRDAVLALIEAEGGDDRLRAATPAWCGYLLGHVNAPQWAGRGPTPCVLRPDHPGHHAPWHRLVAAADAGSAGLGVQPDKESSR